MLDLSTVFRLSALGHKERPLGFITTMLEHGDYKMPTTVIGPIDTLDKPLPSLLEVLIPFPTTSIPMIGSTGIITISKKLAVLTRNLPYNVMDHKVEYVESFQKNDFNDIREVVEKFGGITLFLENAEEATNALECMLEINRDFKFADCYYNTSISSGMSDEKLIGSISFFTLQQTIPIFNRKKIDGLGIVFRLIYPESSLKNKALVENFYCANILSQYEDNLVLVDGTRIKSLRSAPSGLVNYVKERLIIEKRAIKSAKTKTAEEACSVPLFDVDSTTSAMKGTMDFNISFDGKTHTQVTHDSKGDSYGYKTVASKTSSTG